MEQTAKKGGCKLAPSLRWALSHHMNSKDGERSRRGMGRALEVGSARPNQEA